MLLLDAVTIKRMEDGAGSCLLDGMSQGTRSALHLHDHGKHCCNLPWRPARKFPARCPLPETFHASFHLKEMGKGGTGGLILWLCRQFPQQARAWPVKQTWQAEAPITSVRGPHTHAGFIRNRPLARAGWDNVVECLPACLPILSTPWPHTRQGTDHVSRSDHATASA